MNGRWGVVLAAEAVLALGAGIALGPVAWDCASEFAAGLAGTGARGSHAGGGKTAGGAGDSDSTGPGSGPATAGGTAERPPATLPAVSGRRVVIRPLSAGAVTDIMALAKRRGLKKISSVDLHPGYTQVEGLRAGTPFRIQVDRDRSVTVYDSAMPADKPLRNPAAAAKLDVGKVVAKARKQLRTTAKVSYVSVEYDDWWFKTDTVGVQFAGAGRPSFVEYSVKDLKKLTSY